MREVRRLVSTRLKLGELQEICIGLGISRDGRKKDLLKRINDKINSGDESNITDIGELNSEDLDRISDPNFRTFREEQDREYEEGLKQDKIRGVERLLDEKNYSDISVSDMKLYLDSKNICYRGALEKSDLISLLTKSVIERDMNESEKVSEEENKLEDEDVKLSIDELRLARLKFYNSVQ
tara:strand:+ start:323 stop:865 length:543 start_codon:yes stop_codon:yes gene_type:complete